MARQVPTLLTANSDSPIVSGESVSPSDSATFFPTRALWVGTGGTLVVRLVNGDVLTFANVQDGALIPASVDQVRTGTTATGVLALR